MPPQIPQLPKFMLGKWTLPTSLPWASNVRFYFLSALRRRWSDSFPSPFLLSPHRISSWWLYSSLEHHYVWAYLWLSLNLYSLRVSKMGHLYLVLNVMVYPQPTLYKCVWNDLNQHVTEKWPTSHTEYPKPGQCITKLES